MRLRIAARGCAGLSIGRSVACDGVGMTVVACGGDEAGDDAENDGENDGGWFEVQASAETVARSVAGRGLWRAGRGINLERALKVGDELGGHIVAGHVDGVAEILSLTPEGGSLRVRLRLPEALAPLVAPKGSIALNGTSLTVNEVEGCDFGVNLIPHTLAATTWGAAAVGDPVNVEVDTLARYVARLVETGARP